LVHAGDAFFRLERSAVMVSGFGPPFPCSMRTGGFSMFTNCSSCLRGNRLCYAPPFRAILLEGIFHITRAQEMSATLILHAGGREVHPRRAQPVRLPAGHENLEANQSTRRFLTLPCNTSAKPATKSRRCGWESPTKRVAFLQHLISAHHSPRKGASLWPSGCAAVGSIVPTGGSARGQEP